MADKELTIRQDCVKTLLDNRFVHVYDLQYAEGRHYYDASRRQASDLVAVKSDAEAKTMLPDAVSCVVVLKCDGEEDRLLLTMEYRYPAGRFLLSVPAGLIDPEDRDSAEALTVTAARELHEETGLTVGPHDEVKVLNPFVYSTPGMTDESNALVGITLYNPDLTRLNQSGALGSELFDGFRLLTRQEARQMMETGRDQEGNFFSMYTMFALVWFVMGC